MNSDPCPDCDQPFLQLNRRQFLKTTGAGLVAAAAMPLVLPGCASPELAKKSGPETLVKTFHDSLTEKQRAAVCFPFDHPLRSKVDNNWHITEKAVSQFYNGDQQAMIREIFMDLHSPKYAEKVMQQVEHDAGKEGFGGSAIALFGDPGKGKFE